MRCKHCGHYIERGPLRGSIPWVHITPSGVSGWQQCKLNGEKLESMAEPA